MSTISRLYLTTKGAATTSANAGAAGLTSAITSSQIAPIAANYVLADSSVITPTVSVGTELVSTVTLCIHVSGMDAGATGRIVVWEVQSAVSGSAPTAVTAATPIHVEHIEGGLGLSVYPNTTCAGGASAAPGFTGSVSDEVFRIPWYDMPDAAFGATAGSSSAWYATQFLSKNGTSLTNGITFEAWLEY